MLSQGQSEYYHLPMGTLEDFSIAEALPYQVGTHCQLSTGFQLRPPVAVAIFFLSAWIHLWGWLMGSGSSGFRLGLELGSVGRGMGKGLRPGLSCMGRAVLGTLGGREQGGFLMHGCNSAWNIISLFG